MAAVRHMAVPGRSSQDTPVLFAHPNCSANWTPPNGSWRMPGSMTGNAHTKVPTACWLIQRRARRLTRSTPRPGPSGSRRRRIPRRRTRRSRPSNSCSARAWSGVIELFWRNSVRSLASFAKRSGPPSPLLPPSKQGVSDDVRDQHLRLPPVSSLN